MGKKIKEKTTNEDEVLKALEELEGNVEKGGKIPPEMKNANGGLATEGKDLAEEISASEGGGDTKKSDNEEGDEEVSGKKKPEVFKGAKPKMKKKMEPPKDEDESDSESESMDEGSDEDEMSKAESESDEEMSKSKKVKKGEEEESPKKKLKKSFGDRAKETPEIAEVMNVSNFLEGLVDQLSDSDASLVKAVLESADNQVSFNTKLAKATIAIGKRLVASEETNNEILSILKSMGEKLQLTPDPSRQRKSVLHKSEIIDRQIGGEDGSNQEINHGDRRVRKAMSTWLENQVMAGKLPATIVTQYESGYQIDPNIYKAAEPDLKKALG